MSDKGLLSEDRIKTIAQRIIWNAPGEYDEKEWLEYEKLVVEIIGGVVAEAGEEAAKMLDARKTSGGAGYVLMEMARDIRNKISKKPRSKT